MRRKRIEVAVDGLHVYGQMAGALSAVDGEDGVYGSRRFAEPFQIMNGAHRIRHMGDRNDARSVRKDLMQS